MGAKKVIVEIEKFSKKCDFCGGTGKIKVERNGEMIETDCPVCHGKGKSDVSKNIELMVRPLSLYERMTIQSNSYKIVDGSYVKDTDKLKQSIFGKAVVGISEGWPRDYEQLKTTLVSLYGEKKGLRILRKIYDAVVREALVAGGVSV